MFFLWKFCSKIVKHSVINNIIAEKKNTLLDLKYTEREIFLYVGFWDKHTTHFIETESCLLKFSL